MKTETKRILLVVAAMLIAGVGTVVWGFFAAAQTFGIEDRIHGTFFPVAAAIDHFAQSNGAPPKALDELVPSFLASIPTSPLVDKLECRVVGESNWIMNAHSKALKPAGIYSWRSDGRFTDEENANLLKEFHNVAVFRE